MPLFDGGKSESLFSYSITVMFLKRLRFKQYFKTRLLFSFLFISRSRLNLITALFIASSDNKKKADRGADVARNSFSRSFDSRSFD